jgi:hypothetical protein
MIVGEADLSRAEVMAICNGGQFEFSRDDKFQMGTYPDHCSMASSTTSPSSLSPSFDFLGAGSYCMRWSSFS